MKQIKNDFMYELKKKIIIVLVALACMGIIILGILLGKELSQNSRNQVSDIIVETTYYIAEFESNGGTRITEQEIASGGKVIKPANPVKTGYQFKGWYEDDELYDFNSNITKDIILKAKWESISDNEKIYISFDSNGGTIVETVEAEKGSAIEAPLNPSKEGYEFKGWYLNNNLYNFNNNIDENITLLAEWEKVVVKQENNNSNLNENNVNKTEEMNKNEIEISNNKQEQTNVEQSKNEQQIKNESVQMPEKEVDETIFLPAIWQMKVVYKNNGTIVFSNYEATHTSGTEKNLDGIEVLRSTSENGNFQKVATIPSSQNQYTIAGLDRSIPYYYTARVFKTVNGKTKYGDIVFTQYVPAEITNIPSNIYFSTDYGLNINVTCNPIKGATKYYLTKSETQNGKFEYVNYSNTASIKTVWSTRDLYYKIYAYDVAENGQYEIYGPESEAIYIPRNFEDPYVKNIKINKPYEEVWENGNYVKKYAKNTEVSFNALEGANGYFVFQGIGNVKTIADSIEPKFTYETNSIVGKIYVKGYKKGNNYLLYGEACEVKE